MSENLEANNNRSSELDIKIAELEVKNKLLELEEKRLAIDNSGKNNSPWKSPLVIAIIGATIAGLSNAAVGYIDGTQSRKIEITKAEHDRILKMIDVDDPDKAAVNLDFLLKSGLLTDPDLKEDIVYYLNNRPDGTGVFTAPAAGFIGVADVDNRKLVKNTSVAPYRSICQISYKVRSSMQSKRLVSKTATGILSGNDVILSTFSKSDVENFSEGSVVCGRSGPGNGAESAPFGVYRIKDMVHKASPVNEHFYVLFLLDRKMPFSGDFTVVSFEFDDPRPNDYLSLVSYPIRGINNVAFNGMRATETFAQVARVSDDLDIMYHNGYTGSGTSGSPIFRRNDNTFELIAIHHLGRKSSAFEKTAFRVPSALEYDDLVKDLRSQ